MGNYLAGRILAMLATLLVVTIVVFVVISLTPGDPVAFMLGPSASQEQAQQIRTLLGLDRPVWERYAAWLWNASHGDFGVSLRSRAMVMPMLLERLPATVGLMLCAMAVALAVGIPVGVVSATRRNSALDAVSRVVALFGISMPGFWLALVAILVFAYYIPIFPPSGVGTPAHVVLPALTLGSALAGVIMRLTRSSMLEVLGQDYIRSARAKGLGEAPIVFGHALRNALLPVITIVGLQVGALLGGTVVIESVFAWPGLGFFTYQAMQQRDYPVIMGSLLLYATFYLVVNLITDLAYMVADPRIALGRGT